MKSLLQPSITHCFHMIYTPFINFKDDANYDLKITITDDHIRI